MCDPKCTFDFPLKSAMIRFHKRNVKRGEKRSNKNMRHTFCWICSKDFRLEFWIIFFFSFHLFQKSSLFGGKKNKRVSSLSKYFCKSINLKENFFFFLVLFLRLLWNGWNFLDQTRTHSDQNQNRPIAIVFVVAYFGFRSNSYLFPS